jgi:leucine dehydrogenase
MKAAAKQNLVRFFAGKKVLVQGIGHVGETLVDYLTKRGDLLRLLTSMKKNCMIGTKYNATIYTGRLIYTLQM